MRIYISGPITGTEDFKTRFSNKEKELKSEYPNAEIINPALLNEVMPEDATHKEYMRVCFELLGMSDAIYTLPGWEKSKGACMEFGYAIGQGMTIMNEI